MAPEELGTYSFRRVLGRGGRTGVYGGEVWEAEDDARPGPVALKILRVDDEAMLPVQARFVEQAALVATLRHPNVVRVHDVGEVAGTSWVVMELVAGRTLRDATGASVEERVRWLREAALGLAELHGIGVVHRDVKPENIVVREDAGTACLVDLGVPVGSEGEAPADALDDQAAWAKVARTVLGADASEDVARVVDRAAADSREARFPSMRDVVVALGGDEAQAVENAAEWSGRAPPARTLSPWIAVLALGVLITIAALLQQALLD